MARTPVLAAGGIVLRQSRPPLIAVVRLRKGNEWVLPKGKLDDGETPRDAAEREVLEETGHDIDVHEFLGTLAYEAGGRPKIVHYWRMETQGRPTHDLMRDVVAVDWLPLDAAVERLSRDHERAFLANVGPMALESAAAARRSRETSREARMPAPVKRPRRRTGVAKPAPAIAPPVAPLPDEAAMIEQNVAEHGVIEREIAPDALRPDDEAIDAFASLLTRELEPSHAEAERAGEVTSDAIREDQITQDNATAGDARQSRALGVVQRVRGWLRRAV